MVGSVASYLLDNRVRISIYQISGYQISCVLICSLNSEYPWIFTVLQTERKMARRFAKVCEEEIEEAFFYPSDLVNTKTTIPHRVGEERWIYTYMSTTIHLPFGG